MDVILFKSGEGSSELSVSLDENGNFRTVGDTRLLACEAAQKLFELEDTLGRIASEFESLNLQCECPDDGTCSICEIRFLLESYL